MKNNPSSITALLLSGAIAISLSLLGMGCEIENIPAEPEPEPTATPASQPTSNTTPASTPAPAPAPEPAPAPAPAPAPEPEPEPAPVTPPSGGGSFLWEPRSDSVRVVIPASLPHWQFHVFSRRRHYTLYGPDNRGANVAQNVEYILPGGGASWAQKSLNVGDDGTVLVYINTRDVATGSQASAGWRIMNPTRAQSGDGDRLKPGENK